MGLEPGAHPVHLALVAVVRKRRGFVGFSVAGEVRGEDANPSSGEVGDDIAIEVAPGWLAMEAERDGSVPWPFIQVMNAKGRSVLRVNLRVVGREGVFREVLEAGVGGAKDFHGGAPAPDGIG